MPWFVAIEGIDGSGKTSLRKWLYQELRRRGAGVLSIPSHCWLDPDATEIITDAKYHERVPSREALTAAYVRDKELLSARLIEPHRRVRGVLSDRYVWSDVVYHEVLYGTPRVVTAGAYRESAVSRPDLVILVSVSPEVAAERIRARGVAADNRWDTVEILRRLEEGFRAIVADPPHAAPVVELDNSGPPGAMLDLARETLLPRLSGTTHD
ncbi:dTMP kinase [Sorangium sp. So ce1389]|uniref:dTMP kinase n=1 Tax=Sorangium sp. So ce1389 TaxID=3133336 RepID=UPI003F640E13